MNRNGEKPESLTDEEKSAAPVSSDLLSQDNINRFDGKNAKRKKNNQNRKRNNDRRGNDQRPPRKDKGAPKQQG